MKPLIFALAMLILPACVTGKVQEKKKPYHILSGEHFDSPVQATGSGLNAIASVPVLQAKVKDTVIAGRITIEDPLAVIPNDLSLQLWREGKLVGETKPAKTGEFQLRGDFADGYYSLKVSSKLFRGDRDLKIDGFQVVGVRVTAEKR